MTDDAIQSFIDRWSTSGGAERANYALFLSELCDVLEVPRPDPTVPDDDDFNLHGGYSEARVPSGKLDAETLKNFLGL